MKNHEQIKKITITAILGAILTILGFFPIRISALSITLTVIPVAIGIIICGTKTGIILGTLFGFVSFIQCLGYDAFGTTMFNINPFYTFLVCVPTRVLVGTIPGLIFKTLVNKHKHLAQILVCVLVPVLNTLFFMTTLCVCFYHTDYIQSFVSALGATNPLMFVVLFVGINGVVEILAGVLISYPISKALEVSMKK